MIIAAEPSRGLAKQEVQLSLTNHPMLLHADDTEKLKGRMMIDSVVWAQYINETDTQTATSP